MATYISKQEFIAGALEYFRQIEESREGVIITDRGIPVLKVAPFRDEAAPGKLRGTVLRYQDPFDPVATNDGDVLN